MITGFNTDIEFEGKTYHVQTEDKGLARPIILSLIYDRGTILASKRSPYEDLIAAGAVDENVLAERLNKQHRVICAAVRTGRIEDLIRMSQNGNGNGHGNGSKTEPNGSAAHDVAVADEYQVSAIPMPVLEGEFAPIKKPVNIDLNAYAVIEEEFLLPKEAVEIVSELEGKERQASNKLTIELLGDTRFRGGEQKVVSFMIFRGNGHKVVADAQVMIKILGSNFRPIISHARTDQNGLAKVNLQFPTFSEGRAVLVARATSDGEEVELRRVVTHG